MWTKRVTRKMSELSQTNTYFGSLCLLHKAKRYLWNINSFHGYSNNNSMNETFRSPDYLKQKLFRMGTSQSMLSVCNIAWSCSLFSQLSDYYAELTITGLLNAVRIRFFERHFLSPFFSFQIFTYIFAMYGCIDCMYVCILCAFLVSLKIRNVHEIIWKMDIQMIMIHHEGVGNQLRSLWKRSTITTGPSHQHPKVIFLNITLSFYNVKIFLLILWVSIHSGMMYIQT